MPLQFCLHVSSKGQQKWSYDDKQIPNQIGIVGRCSFFNVGVLGEIATQ